jgi:hypothetical protein
MRMAKDQDRNRRQRKGDDGADSWIPVAIMLVVFPPVGAIMLLKRFHSLTREESSERRAKSSSSAGSVLLMLGALMLFLGVRSVFPALFAIGLALLAYSSHLGRTRRRFEKYLNVVGRRKVMRVREIAAAIPVTEEQACRDLERMIEDGRFPEGAYLDMSTRALVIDGHAAEPAPARGKSTCISSRRRPPPPRRSPNRRPSRRPRPIHRHRRTPIWPSSGRSAAWTS